MTLKVIVTIFSILRVGLLGGRKNHMKRRGLPYRDKGELLILIGGVSHVIGRRNNKVTVTFKFHRSNVRLEVQVTRETILEKKEPLVLESQTSRVTITSPSY